MENYYQVITSCQSQAEAKRMARLLVEMRLAACAQVTGPVHSTYWWEGRIEVTEEWICVLKCPAEKYARIEEAIRRAHTYSVPEILAIPVKEGNRDYLAWLRTETKDTGDDRATQPAGGQCRSRRRMADIKKGAGQS